MITMYPTAPFTPNKKVNYMVSLGATEGKMVWLKVSDKKWSFNDGRLPPAVTCFGTHSGNELLLLHETCVIGLSRTNEESRSSVLYDADTDTLKTRQLAEPVRDMEFGSARTDFNNGGFYNTHPTDIHSTIMRTAMHRLFNLHRTHFRELESVAEINFSSINERHNNDACIVYYKGGIYVLREDFSDDPMPRVRKERKKLKVKNTRPATVYHISVIKHKEDKNVPEAEYLLKNADLIYRASKPLWQREGTPTRCTVSIQTKFDLSTGSEESTRALFDLLEVEYDVVNGFETMDGLDGNKILCPSTFIDGEHEWAMVKTKALRFNDEFLQLATELCGVKNMKSLPVRYFTDPKDAVITLDEIKKITDVHNSVNPIVQVYLDHKELDVPEDSRGGFGNNRRSASLDLCLAQEDFTDWVNAQLEEIDVCVPVLTPRLGTVLNARLANLQATGLIQHRNMPGLQRPTEKEWFRSSVFNFEYTDHGYLY